MPTAQEIVSDIDHLASMPAVYLRVKQVVEDPAGSVQDLANVLCHDPAMSARVLRVANSPLFGMNRRVDTISRALNLLGTQQVHDLVLSWAISSTFVGIRPHGLDIKTFWQGSVRRAIASRHLASDNGILDANRLFVEGLLSDIGHLIMYTRIPALAAQAREVHATNMQPLHKVERELVGCNYAEVGGALVRAWALPDAFHEPIVTQIDPVAATAQPTEACILHVAGFVGEIGVAQESPVGAISPFAIALLDLDKVALSRLIERTAGDMDMVMGTFFPDLSSS